MNIELELITACINRERKAQYELYKESYGFMMAICRRYAGSMYEADDLLNICFLKILTKLDSYQPKIPFGVWMRRVMINTIIDEFRKHAPKQEKMTYVEEYYDQHVSTSVNEALSSLSLDEIQQCIDRLPNVSQRVFNLFVIDGYSHKEIAEMLNMSEGTSKWHVNSSKQKLQEMLQELFPKTYISISK